MYKFVTMFLQYRTGSVECYQWDVQGPDGTLLQLVDGFRITVTKGEVFAMYPLEYVQVHFLFKLYPP